MGFRLADMMLRTGHRQMPVTMANKDNRASSGARRWGYGEILDNLDVGVLVMDLVERRIDYHNPVFVTVLQDTGLSENYDRLEKLLLSDLKMPASGPASLVLPHRERTFGCSIYEIGERYRCVFIRDVSEKMRLESIAQAVNTMDNIGFIFSGVRHEIGNPLNSLKMGLSVLRNNLGSFTAETILEYIDRGLADIGRMEFLLKSMKSFAMFEKVDIKEVELVEFMRHFLPLVRRELGERDITLVYDEPARPTWTLIDSRALHQALLNLFANAAEALEQVEDPQIHVFAEERESLVNLVVSDNGCGMTATQRKHLFKPFNTSKAHGNGLGLVITRKLLAQMNADIEIESSPGNGTLAIISLPGRTGTTERDEAEHD
jgi:C4-dicarboxylate-specific signal transduction histidine kinase